MMTYKLKEELYVMPMSNGLKTKVVDGLNLYLELSKMDDFTRASTIKKMSEEAGYEVVNYKLLQQLYKTDINNNDNDSSMFVVNDNSTTERDYIKAYMKLLSK